MLELKKLDPSNGDRYMRLLEEFLLDSRTLRNLFDYEFSGDLLRYWREVGTFLYETVSQECYTDCLIVLYSIVLYCIVSINLHGVFHTALTLLKFCIPRYLHQRRSSAGKTCLR